MPEQETVRTEAHSDAVPASRLRRTTRHPALHALDVAQLKELRTTSRLLYVLGVLWGISGLGIAYEGGGCSPPREQTSHWGPR